MNMDYKYTIRELREPYPVPCTLEALMEEFKYNSEMDFEENFERWYVINSDERMYYCDPVYDRDTAKNVFVKWMQNRWQVDQRKKEPS